MPEAMGECKMSPRTLCRTASHVDGPEQAQGLAANNWALDERIRQQPGGGFKGATERRVNSRAMPTV